MDETIPQRKWPVPRETGRRDVVKVLTVCHTVALRIIVIFVLGSLQM